MEQEKLLDYVTYIFEEKKEYLKVSEIGLVMTELLGTDLCVTGTKVNEMLIHEGYQTYTEDDEYFSYIPQKKDISFKKTINEEKKYGIIQWHYSIIPILLNIDLKKDLKSNKKRIKRKIESYRFIFANYEIDDKILKENLLKILN